MNLIFKLPMKAMQQDATDYINEFKKYHSVVHGSGGLDLENYNQWIVQTSNSHHGSESREGVVPASTYFVYEEVTNRLIGMVNIRHCLNDFLINSGSGHIGYSVRPTERKKGYATKILRQALLILKKYEPKHALLGCYKENIASIKTIKKQGGRFVKEIIEADNAITFVYSINLETMC